LICIEVEMACLYRVAPLRSKTRWAAWRTRNSAQDGVGF
jgi:hypothetical protein